MKRDSVYLPQNALLVKYNFFIKTHLGYEYILYD